MSKVSDAKRIQGYKQSPSLPVCRNCHYFESQHEKLPNGYVSEFNLRCGLGKFAVKPQASCNEWLP